MNWSKRGATVACVYLGIVALSAIPVAFEAGKFAGVYMLLSTVPWSLLSVLIGEEWRFAVIGMGALVNAAILYSATWLTERKRRVGAR